MQVRPFPFDRLEKLTRAQTHAVQRFDALAATLDLHALGIELARLLGCHVNARVTSHVLVRSADLADVVRGPSVALLCERETGGPARRLVVEASPPVAAHFVDRALGGDGTLASARTDTLDDLSCGALAYLAARLLTSARTTLALRDVLLDQDVLLAAFNGNDVWVFAIEVTLGAHAHTLRVLLPDALVATFTPLAAPAAFEVVDALPFTLFASAGRALLDAATLHSLEVGDVLVLDDSGLVHFEGTFTGTTFLCTSHGARVLLARIGEARLEIEQACLGEHSAMTTGKSLNSSVGIDDATRLAGGAPIEARVELARFSLTLAELSALGPGHVLVTGRRIGEHVTLRAGDLAFAEGELVDVEGEVGVRITRLLR